MQEEEYISNTDFDKEIFVKDLKILDERRQKRLNGESSLHSWEDVKKAIKDHENR